MEDANGIEYPFIAGRRDTSRSTETFDSVNPATEEVIARVVQCDQGHVDDATTAAREAQRAWWRVRGDPGRAHLALGRPAGRAQRRAGQARHHGHGQADLRCPGQYAATAKLCRYYATSDKIWGDMVPVTPGHLSYTMRDPLGVSGIVLPWNGPIQAFVGRVAAAISCGNAVVVKPSEFSPLSALRLAELTIAAGMPEGLVNVLTGDGRVGAMLTSHPGVDGVSFTGSVPTGRKVNEAAASTFKKVVLEMGGKSPSIVFADADIDGAVRGTLWGVFYNTGQVCCAGTRLVVERSVADEFVARLKEQASRVRVGDPMDPTVDVGPIVCRNSTTACRATSRSAGRKHMLSSAADARAAYLATAGSTSSRRSSPRRRRPCASRKRRSSVRVLTVLTFDDEEEALALANDVE